MSGDFFEGVDQFKTEIEGAVTRTPTFYHDARGVSLLFAARILEARRLLPDRRFVPAQIFPGIAGVHVTVFEYLDTDIGPYNEVSIGILLNSPQFLQIPCYNAFRQYLQNSFCTYILHLPVCTDVPERKNYIQKRKRGEICRVSAATDLALDGAVEIYNFPKLDASITFADSVQDICCEVLEGSDMLFSLRGRKLAATGSAVLKIFCKLYHYQQPQETEFKLNLRSFGITTGRGGNAVIELGQHRVGRELDRLLISRTPISYHYVPSMQGILYGPEHLSLASLAFFVENRMGINLDEFIDAVRERQEEGER